MNYTLNSSILQFWIEHSSNKLYSLLTACPAFNYTINIDNVCEYEHLYSLAQFSSCRAPD